jgi:hypothetical protein
MGHVPAVTRPVGIDQPRRNRRRTQTQSGLAGTRSRTPPVKDVGEPDEGEPHVRIDGRELEKE